MYEEYVSLRTLRRFFFSPSAGAADAFVFFAALELSEVVFAGALEAVEAGALPAVEAGLGAMDEAVVKSWGKGGGGIG
jgi:hypothetical protein